MFCNKFIQYFTNFDDVGRKYFITIFFFLSINSLYILFALTCFASIFSLFLFMLEFSFLFLGFNQPPLNRFFCWQPRFHRFLFVIISKRHIFPPILSFHNTFLFPRSIRAALPIPKLSFFLTLSLSCTKDPFFHVA